MGPAFDSRLTQPFALYSFFPSLSIFLEVFKFFFLFLFFYFYFFLLSFQDYKFVKNIYLYITKNLFVWNASGPCL